LMFRARRHLSQSMKGRPPHPDHACACTQVSGDISFFYLPAVVWRINWSISISTNRGTGTQAGTGTGTVITIRWWVVTDDELHSTHWCEYVTLKFRAGSGLVAWKGCPCPVTAAWLCSCK
jgi:hypothetical protein